MSEPEQMVVWAPSLHGNLRDRFEGYDDPAELDVTPSAPTTGCVSLGFIGAALRRRVLVWSTLAIVGLIIGGGYNVADPGSYQATTSVLLVDNPNQNPGDEVLTDLALAQSIPVAQGVIAQLGLNETPSSFLGTYSVAATTNQVVLITASGTSSQGAVGSASAVATQFLKYRASYAREQLQLTATLLDQEVSQAQQQLDSINRQISQANAAGEQARLPGLAAKQTAATHTLDQVRQYVSSTLTTTRTYTEQMAQGSQVLDPALPGKRSTLKNAAIYGVGGLAGGLIIGLAIVVLGAVTSDRLRRRDDIAYAFGAPVRMSTGRLRKSRWAPGLPGRAAGRKRDTERVVAHLRSALPASTGGATGFAVVAVDDPETVARLVVALVNSIGKRRRIVLADLSGHASAARLLGVAKPGIAAVDRDGYQLVVVVPAADDVAPVGPFPGRGGEVPAQHEKLVAACAQADLVLSLVTLDPAFGADHLRTWATDAVGVVTAGRSTALKVHAAGEMIRLARTRLNSVVVLGADAGDESLGASSLDIQPDASATAYN